MKTPNRWIEKINRSAFFLVAVFLHLLVIVAVAGYVLFPAITQQQPPEFAQINIKQPAPPPAPPNDNTASSESIKISQPDNSSAIVTPSPSSDHFQIPPPKIGVEHMGQDAMAPNKHPAITGPKPGFTPDQIKGFQDTARKWYDLNTLPEALDDPHSLQTFPIPIFLAIYADGDWSCNNSGGVNGLTAGCLPNLAEQMRVLSHGNLKVGTIKPVRIDSPELLDDMPPFLFFTGHRDFKLTDAEIMNLRKYLQRGGAIWGDSAFSGSGSRFDVAFHREMKLVLPDADIQFEPLPLSHPIFTHSYFQLSDIAAGMNYRKDPIEVMNIQGKLAVIYTPDDYSDMMTMLLVPGADPPQMDLSFPPTPGHPLFTYGSFYGDRGIYYRNYDPKSAEDVYRLSTNIVVHLLLRYGDVIQMQP